MGLIERADWILREMLEWKERQLQHLLAYAPHWLTPDQLSFTRIGFAFLTTIFILAEKPDAGCIFYVTGALLDLLDGPLARLRNRATERGEFLDMFADRVLGGLALIAIFLTKTVRLTPTLFWLMLAMDLILVFLWFIGKTMPVQIGRRRRIGANLWGKWKFSLQSVAIPMLLLEWTRLAHLILWGAVGLSVASLTGHLTFKNPK